MKSLNLALSACVLALATCACLNIYSTSSSGQAQGGSGSGGVTGPDIVPSVVTAVAVSKFGEDCDGPADPTDNPTTVRVGCTARLTCTPKCGGRDCTVPEHGDAPAFFGVTAGGQFVQVAGEDNLFNLRARGLGPGDVTFSCTVKSVTSAPRTLTVVN